MEREIDAGKAYEGKTFQCIDAVLTYLARPMLEKVYSLLRKTDTNIKDLSKLAVSQARCGYFLGAFEAGTRFSVKQRQDQVKKVQDMFAMIADIVGTTALGATALGPLLLAIGADTGVMQTLLKKLIFIGIQQTGIAISDPLSNDKIKAFQDGERQLQRIDLMFQMIIGGDTEVARYLMFGVYSYIDRVVTRAGFKLDQAT